VSARGLICVFAKPPVAGTVKTRLAASVGDAGAAALASAFLRDTWDAVASVPWARPILATTGGDAHDFALIGRPVTWLQGEGDLGARLERILRRGLAVAGFVIAVGSDSPGLPRRLLEGAFAELARADAVLGPAEDGGFYLLGLRRCPGRLLEDLPWSRPTTFAATRDRLLAHGMTVAVLEPWFDVDRPEDLDRLRGQLARGEVRAEATARLLLGEPR
jgi:rSAM/selenodomain-associated transferase 1